jgi:hypothetical protein
MGLSRRRTEEDAMFGLQLANLVLIPPPWDLLLSGLLPFVIVALILPDDFMMPRNEDGDIGDEEHRLQQKAKYHASGREPEQRKDK